MARRSDTERRIQRAMRRTVADIVLTNDAIAKQAGLTLVEAQVLHLLSLSSEAITAGQLSQAAGLASSTATRVIDRLERAGYAVRVPDRQDRRKVYVQPVAAKLAEMERRYEDVAVGMNHTLARFTAAQLQVIAEFLESLTSQADQGSARPEG